MKRLGLMALLAFCCGHAAQADIFSRLSGTFGDPAVPEESCTANPVFASFTSDHRRVTYSWASPVPSYTGAMITGFGGTVVADSPGSVTMRRDNETRQLRDGSLVLWIMRAIVQPDGFCWTRPDWAPDDCAPMERCGAAPNS